MKKFFTLALLAATVLTANAESRKWDFTNWSSATIANLSVGCSANFSTDADAQKGAGGWSDIEKAAGTQSASLNGKRFWEVTAQGSTTAKVTLQANGQNISELEGLYYNNTTARSLSLVVNDDANNGYHGTKFLWMGSKTKNYFTIPNVAKGAKITIGVESHKTTEARGIGLYTVKDGAFGTRVTTLKDPDGNAVAVPTTYEEQTWLVPEDLSDGTENEDGTVNVLIYNTNGCHMYFINVDEGDNFGEARNVAWIGSDQTTTYAMRPTDGFEWTDLDANGEKAITAEELRSYEAVVIGTDVTADMISYQTIADNIAFTPIVNLNNTLFGYTAVGGDETTLTATDATAEYWEGVPLEEGAIDYLSNVAVTLPEKFAADEVIAKQGDAVAFHRHDNGAGKNSYFLVGSDDTSIGASEWSTMLGNFINEAADTKRDVTAAATPTITLKYADQQTTVTLACATGGSKVYYKEGDGEYQLYTEPIVYTAETNLTAYAVSEGFLQSAEATKAIDIQSQAAAPEVSYSAGDKKTTITVTAEDGATIYYSFSGQKTAARAATYTDAVEITEPGTITAFAVVDGKIQSELTSVDIPVYGIPAVTDTISHFTANETDWFNNASVTVNGTTQTIQDAIAANASGAKDAASGNAKAVYYFGKSAWKYYSDEVESETTNDDGTTTTTYKPDANALRTVTSSSNSDWVIKSQGQVVTGETNQGPLSGIGNTTAGRYADAAIDEIGGAPTTGFIDFGAKNSGEPYSMRFETTKTFEGTFDVVTYLGNGGTGDPDIELQKSTDGTTWETVGKVNYTNNQRYYKKTRFNMSETTPVYLRVAQVSGSTKGYIYDIYVIKTEGTTGISETIATETKAVKVKKFVKNGQIYIQKGDALFTVSGVQVK